MAKPARNPEQAELAFPKTGTKKAGRTPEELARAAIARMPTTVSGGRSKMTVTLFLTREARSTSPPVRSVSSATHPP
jgi:hypothetical protein